MNLDTIQASALAALPDLGSDGALPADIQVFPPGKAVKFTLQDYPGEQFEMNVDAAVAAKANADLQSLLARAGYGQTSEPFADKNHEDAEATFHPLRYFWGGEDPKTGGVRLVPDWTPFGATLVRAKAFKYFSQNFLFSKAKKKFLGLINENVGGLVNRPGFATQAAFAKAAPALATVNQKPQNMLTQEDTAAIGLIITDALKPVSEKIVALEAKAKADPATTARAGADNQLAETITNAITAAVKPLQTRLEGFEKTQQDTVKAQAKAAVSKYVGRVGLAPQDTKAIDFYEKSYLADPATTEEILGKLPARAGAGRLTASNSGTHTGTNTLTEPEDIFEAKAKAFATDHKLSEVDGLIAFGRTSEGAMLQEQYREKVRTMAARQ
jgi:hypothetical protein